MAKSIGMPEGFSLNIPNNQKQATEERIEIGDYLDETTAPRPRVRKQLPVESVQDEIAKTDNNESLKPPLMATQGNPGHQAKLNTDNIVGMPASKPTAKRKTPKRKQLNMNPKTLERLDELVSMVQEYSPQSDAAASEVMEAIIQAHFEARDKLNFRAVPERGRWGSPTAQAFKDALATSFKNSILDYYGLEADSTKKAAN